ncbi:hypothetical protein TWF569_008567 [Orbilia oligospora]|uniref:Uncharacterized protein n=2 Tax=Orbilia oligospora TaxID=2813651 RepID=A0A7C8N580_ORBOL|nr:hypothetical protein TWF103_001781 [Orbilia oligospora]KAF3086442.1 hypothetical protein TWF102_011042 [Orbilia oligospora]KAF3086671.1 hypothetical protein TWF706_011409 [Orbilia oligospora]KAF3086672.1 hypothetical protein TWF706_011409 [Orbilia oligospora]KAF3139317.1 hypothetical protein TWF569_008567 [Orbilia oligospora]
MMDHNSFSFTWRGLYEFKDSARKEMISHFNSLSDFQDTMKVQYNPMRNSFTVIGPRERDNEAQQAFVGVVNSFIEKLYTNNLGNNQYLTRGKIVRPNTTQMFVRELQWSDDPKVLYKDDADEISEVFEEIKHEVEGVRFEKFHKWTPKYRDTFRECFFGDGVDAIDEISKATRCVMKVDWVTREVKIGAHSDIALEAGLEKLNLAEKYFNWDYRKFTSHIINSDGRAYFEIRLVLITKQITNILRTTLFPPADQYSSLGGRDRLASARLAEYNPASDKFDNVVFNCIPTYNAGQTETDIWKGYTYTPHVARTVTPILSDEPLISVGEVPKQPGETVTAQPPPAPIASKRPAPTVAPSIRPSESVAGSLNLGIRPQDIIIDLEAQQIDFPTLAPKRKARNAKPDAKTTASPSVVSEAPSQQTPVTSQTSVNPSPGGLSIATTRPSGPSGSEASSATARRPRNPRKVEKAAEDGEGSQGAGTEVASVAGSIQTERTFKTMSLASEPSTETTGNKQEYQTRTYKNTQSQKAPRRKANFDNFEALQKHQDNVLHTVFSEGFEDVRRFSGELKFEARLGRICFPLVPKKYLKSSYGFQWASWEAELERAGIQTLFTDIISVSPSDADFVVGLKVSKGDAMFENPPSTRKVTYDIEGLTFQKVPFIISINAETFEFEVRGKEENFGNVYVNCPCSTWDADFRLTGSKIMKALRPQAQKLIETLEVDTDLHYPDLIINTYELGLEITGCVVRRQTHHMIVPSDIHFGHEFTLVVTENIELRLQDRKDLPNIIRFCAVPGVESFRQNMTWYTMSVVSDPIDQIFWKNRSLAITELTDTAAKDLLFKKGTDDKTMLAAMFQVVCNLISKINNVGYDNIQFTHHTA